MRCWPADGARVARVSLAEDPQDQSIVKERSVATPHKIMKEVSVSSENDTVLTASRTAARLTLDVPRLFDEWRRDALLRAAPVECGRGALVDESVSRNAVEATAERRRPADRFRRIETAVGRGRVLV